MSVAELKLAVDQLSVEGRRELLEHLQRLNNAGGPEELGCDLAPLLPGVKAARKQAYKREGIATEDARRLVDSWVSR